jgi:hypothetical protein
VAEGLRALGEGDGGLDVVGRVRSGTSPQFLFPVGLEYTTVAVICVFW